MTRRSAGTLGVLAVLAAVVALAAQAGTVAQGGAPTAVLHAADGSEIHGGVSLLPIPVTGGTTVAVTVHGLPANARVDVRLHAGRSLAHVSSSSTALPSGTAGESGSFRAYRPRALTRRGRRAHHRRHRRRAHDPRARQRQPRRVRAHPARLGEQTGGWAPAGVAQPLGQSLTLA